MSLLVQTLIISLGMALLSVLPLFSASVRRHSHLFFLAGTGALAGLCAFDLLPDLYEMGGRSSFMITGVVWAAYSVMHLLNIGHHHHHHGADHSHGHEGDHSHDHAHDHESENEPYLPFLISMMVHCFSSGILLVASNALSSGMGKTVFLALIAHKGYESLTVSSVLVERIKTQRQRVMALAGFAGALPVGVVFALCFQNSVNQKVALIATSLAVGSLLGCLIFDFLIPSLSHLKTRKMDLGWVVIGLLITQAMMKIA
jgi:zinc transporter ZupT